MTIIEKTSAPPPPKIWRIASDQDFESDADVEVFSSESNVTIPKTISSTAATSSNQNGRSCSIRAKFSGSSIDEDFGTSASDALRAGVDVALVDVVDLLTSCGLFGEDVVLRL